MNILKITKADLDERGFYAASESVNFDGAIEIDGNLGWVQFRGFLRAAAGIAAEAGSGIEAGFQISARKAISAKLRIFAGSCIWRVPAATEMTIIAREVNGSVCYGDVKLLTETTEAPTVATDAD
jgi:hypothetical protein